MCVCWCEYAIQQKNNNNNVHRLQLRCPRGMSCQSDSQKWRPPCVSTWRCRHERPTRSGPVFQLWRVLEHRLLFRGRPIQTTFVFCVCVHFHWLCPHLTTYVYWVCRLYTNIKKTRENYELRTNDFVVVVVMCCAGNIAKQQGAALRQRFAYRTNRRRLSGY